MSLQDQEPPFVPGNPSPSALEEGKGPSQGRTFFPKVRQELREGLLVFEKGRDFLRPYRDPLTFLFFLVPLVLGLGVANSLLKFPLSALFWGLFISFTCYSLGVLALEAYGFALPSGAHKNQGLLTLLGAVAFGLALRLFFRRRKKRPRSSSSKGSKKSREGKGKSPQEEVLQSVS